jgi:hypothetical protein
VARVTASPVSEFRAVEGGGFRELRKDSGTPVQPTEKVDCPPVGGVWSGEEGVTVEVGWGEAHMMSCGNDQRLSDEGRQEGGGLTILGGGVRFGPADGKGCVLSSPGALLWGRHF